MDPIQGAGQSTTYQPPPTPATKPSSALQEAQETPATTKAEAAKGDQQAAGKLAMDADGDNDASTATPSKSVSTTTGGNIDVVA